MRGRARISAATGSFRNTGLIEATANSGTEGLNATYGGGRLANLSISTLTGGTIQVDDGTTLDLTIGGTIATDAGSITLNGPASSLLLLNASSTFVPVESGLTAVAANSALSLLAGRSWTGNSLTDSGRVALGGGVFTAPSLTLAATGTFTGFGTLAAATANAGLIDAAGGDLVLASSPIGAGTERIEAASTLELTTASANAVTFNGLGARLQVDVPGSYTGTLTSVAAGDGLILQGVSATSASTSGSVLTVALAGGGTESFALAGPLSAIREGVTQDGLGDSSVSFYRYAAPAAVAAVALPNHHVGDTVTVAVPVTNTDAADGYSEVLDAQITNPSAAVTVAGTVTLLSAGQTSNALSVTLLTATAGAKTGTATVALQTDGTGVDGNPALALASQTLNVSGSVFNYATAAVAPNPVAFGQHHVGDTAVAAPVLYNTAAPGVFSENLDGSFSGASGGLTDSGTVSELAAGGASTALHVTLATGTAGAITGAATLALVSDGSTLDTLGTTALASQVITGSGSVFNYATASVVPTAAAFGQHHVGDLVTQAIMLANTAAAGAFSENLNAAFGAATGALTDSGSVGELAAGASSSALRVTLATGTAGVVSGAATLGLVSDGSTLDTLGTTALASQVITASGSVFNYATAALAPTTIAFGQHHVGDTIGQALTLSNTAAAGAFSENLDAAFSAASGGLADSGTVSGLAAGGSSTALRVALASGTAGVVSGAATLGLASDGGTLDTLGTTALASQVVTASGTLFNEAVASASGTAVAFGQHHVGDVVAQAVTLANTAPAGAFSEGLDAAFTGASGGLSDSGAVGTLAAGASSTALRVTLATGLAGAITGAATIGLASDGAGVDTLGTTALGPVTVSAAGSVFNEATAALGASTIAFGIHHVGDTLTQSVLLTNTAPAGAFSENLDAAFTGASGGLTGSGMVGELAGGSSSSALGVTLAGTASGVITGAATLGLVSDGSTLDTLGATALAPQVITASGTFDSYATAALSGSGPGKFSGSGSAATLDFGTVGMSTAVSEAIAVLNTALGTADALDSSFAEAGSAAFANAGFAAVANEAGGGMLNAGTITLLTSQTGQFSETLTLSAFGTNASGYVGALQTELLTVSGTVVACFVAGTRIATPDGDRPVESLAIGDPVTTAEGGIAALRWIGRRSYNGRMLAGRDELLPVRIRAGALGGRLPRRDLLVSPKHAMALDGLLIPAFVLVNGTSIVRERGMPRVDYLHLELERHDIILAEGAPTETFVDEDSRLLFHNASEFAELYPDAEPVPRCAPLSESGFGVQAVLKRLAGLAARRAA